MIEVFILSIIQGITEFLPVSSSSHLIIISEYINFENQSLSIDVSLHIGSFIAVITYFREEILNFVKNKELFFKIFLSSIPVMIFGFLLVKFQLIDQLRNLQVIGWTTIIFGILLYISDKFSIEKNLDNNFTIKSAMIIGVLQIFSLIPGVSRSGITITAARILKFNRLDSAKISFLLSIPTLAAVSFFGFKNLVIGNNIDFSILNLISIFLSFVFSLITIKFFLNYIQNFNLNIFIIYRIILGSFLLTIAYL
jgi:undecaprenyl-diphosphatase